MFGAQMNIREFARLFFERAEGSKAKIPKGMEDAFTNPQSDGEREIKAIDFSVLGSTRKREVLEAANAARCNCGCGMTLAQCVATDSTCPIRQDNVDKIKRMVSDAAKTKS